MPEVRGVVRDEDDRDGEVHELAERFLGRGDDLAQVQRRRKGLHDVVERVEQVVGDRHAGDLVQCLLLTSLRFEPELAREATDERGEHDDDRREDPGAQCVLGDAGERTRERDRRTRECRGRETLAVAPAVRGEDHDREWREDERAGPVAGQGDRDDCNRQVEQEHRFGAPGRGLQTQGFDRSEDRVGEDDDDGAEQDRVRSVIGGGDQGDGNDQGEPAERGHEGTQVRERGDRTGVQTRSDPGATGRPAADRVVVAPAAARARGSVDAGESRTCVGVWVTVESSTVLLVGLTGGIGAGKSTVSDLLTERGAVIIDGDLIARRVVEPGQPALAALVERFGPEILAADGTLDRPALAAKAFASDEERKALEAITHPAIGAEFLREMSEAPEDAVVVNDVPLLVESNQAESRGYKFVIVVEAPREVRLDRLVQRGLTREDAEARMAAQATDEERRAVATHLLDNGGTREELEAQVEVVWADLLANRDLAPKDTEK